MRFFSVTALLTTVFFAIWCITVFVIFRFEQPVLAQFGYTLFAGFSAAAYLVKSTKLKQAFACISLASMVLVGSLFQLDIEVIEEVYILIPLLYVMTFPGSLFPILAAFLLLTAYIPSFSSAIFADVLEDAAELIFITIFATIMAFFQKRSRDQMKLFRKESYTDYLTGLSNRKHFLETLARCISQCEHNKQLNFALLVVDLDGFKNLNDRIGHIAGDSALKLVANRFATLANDDYRVFRTGGDEFAFICLPKEDVKPYATSLAQQIIAQSKSRYVCKEKKYTLSASIGIAIMPNDAQDSETLCSYTDLAMYKAKREGKNTYYFYQPSLSESATRRYTLETDLKSAIQNGQMSLYYQPKVCAKNSVIMSAEALLRWHHPSLGFISPCEFIPIAEQTGQIIAIGNWVIKEASMQALKWQQVAHFERIAVNVSAIQLAQDDFIEQTLATLNETGCPPSLIEIEQTESALMDNMQENIQVLSALKQAGFTLSLDDFGTAYSSLSQLSQLPIDVLKIDKSFVDNCATCERAHMVVKTIIQLANNLGMHTIAEGVETQAQLDVLNSEGCYMYQGYYFAKPLPQNEFEQMLESQSLARVGTH